MDGHGMNADLIGGFGDASECIDQKNAAKPPTLFQAVNSKPAEMCGGDWIPGNSARQRFRKFAKIHTAGGDGVKACDGVGVVWSGDVGS